MSGEARFLTEKVARAICRAAFAKGAGFSPADVAATSERMARAVDENWPSFVDEAEAAIAAVLENP